MMVIDKVIDESNKKSVKWEAISSTSSDRVNLFSKRGNSTHHLATITSGSLKNLRRFDESIALITAAPELLELLTHTKKILNDFRFVQAAEVQHLERQISEALNSLTAIIPIDNTKV